MEEGENAEKHGKQLKFLSLPGKIKKDSVEKGRKRFLEKIEIRRLIKEREPEMQHKKRGERIVKAKPSGYEEREIRRLGKIRLLIGVLLLCTIAAGGWLAWVQVMTPYEPESNSSSSETSAILSSQEEDLLPVYHDDFNLKIASSNHPLEEGEEPELGEYEGIQVDKRIIPALKAMMEAAQKQGVPLKITQGYVSAEEQDKLFQAEVERLMEENHYSQVMAEQTAVQTVSRGGEDESQTGMSVRLAAEGEEGSFEDTAQYRWGSRHCVEYGFVIRYPADKESATGHSGDNSYFRYVGTQAAMRMRQLQMCLEEYAEYVDR